MTGSSGHACPECGTPREADRTPSCDCTARASEALHRTRTADAAAAEDFDPLRIRPYVEAGDRKTDPPPGPARGAGPVGVEGSADRAALGDETAPAARSGPRDEAAPPAEPDPVHEAAPTAKPDPVDGPVAEARRTTGPAEEAGRANGAAVGAAATRGAGARPEGSAGDLPPFGDFGAEPVPAPVRTGGITRRRRAALLCVAGAGVVVVAAAGLASGLFSYREPTRDRSAPEVRESVPAEAPTSPDSAFSVRPASASASPVRLPVTTPSAPEPAGSAGPPGATSSASRSATRPAPSDTATGSPGPSATARVLRRGDQGLEVIDLQTRLSALNLYTDHIDGVYTRPVEDAVRTYQLARGVHGDTLGVYGAATRAKLEAETW
ncbi:peptidoglycan-binding protein [Streptomyces sp. NPDC056580]|uniref:peptidoglycan-binding domain-containing protein n=1 Tax=Streptomyces sp. NPDC056580 TaxID=3345872 RepID=UPI00368AD686